MNSRFAISILMLILQVSKLVGLLNAVFARQGRTFQKDEKVLAFPPDFYSRLFNFYENMTKT